MRDDAPEGDLCKETLRATALARRRDVADKDGLSRDICAKLSALAEYRNASTVLFYVDCRSEVRTRPLIVESLQEGRRIAVPYCTGDRLTLFHLERMDELTVGRYKILEPLAALRSLPEKRVESREVDLAIVPGVAFDRHGGRLGHGQGYYDKLLRDLRADAAFVALAYEAQLVDNVPLQRHDVQMHKIVTDAAVYDCRPTAGTAQ